MEVLLVPRLVFTVLAATVVASAQGGAPGGQATALEQFAEKLKLDTKTQIPTIEQVFTEAARAAVPVGNEMLQIRRRLLASELAGQAADVTTATAAMAAAAEKMTTIEVQAYLKVFEILKPNQQSKTTQAFPLMAGLFQPAPSRGGGRGMRGGGGQ